MFKKILILVAFISIKIGAFANFTVKDTSFVERLTKLADFGNNKLKSQVAANAENDKKNLHQLNNYVIDFSDFEKTDATVGFNDLTDLLKVGSSYSGQDVLSAANISELNAYLVAVNSSSDPDIYIAVNLRLGLIVETKDIQPEQLNEIDKEVVTNKIATIRVQNYSQVQSNHALIKTHFDQNLAAGVSGDYVLFTWGKYYKIAEVPSYTNPNGVDLKLNAGGHYGFYYDKAGSITEATGQKITAYIERATNFQSLPRKTSLELIAKYKTVIDGLKVAIANKNDINKILLEGIIKQNNLKNLGKTVLTQYYNSARGDGALDKLTDLAVYLDNIDTAIYNGYVEGVHDELDRHNYNFWLDYIPETGSFSKENLTTVLANFKKYNEAFLYIREKANKGVITKAEFKAFFDTYLTWGGSNEKYFHTNPLVLLSPDEKVNILKAIAKDLSTSYINRSIQDYARDEDLVISVLKTTKPEKTLQILEALKSTRLLYKMIDKFTFADFNNVIDGLSTWIFYNYPVKNEQKRLSDKATAEIAWGEYLGQKRAVYFNNNYFGRRNGEGMDANGNINITVKKWFNSANEYDLSVDPYKYVFVRFENDFEIAGSRFAKGQSYLLPALTVYMLFVEDTRAKWGKTGKILLDAALCAVGVGEISAAIKMGQWGRFALATLDLGMGVADIIINTAFEDEIKSEYPNFFEAWQKISLAYGLGRLAQVGLESAIKEVRGDAYDIYRRGEEFSDETRAFAERVQNTMTDPEQFAEFSEFSDDMRLENIWPTEPHVVVDNVATKVQDKKDHIFTIEWKTPAQAKFSGVHHQSALDAVGDANWEKHFIEGDPNGVYSAQVMVKNSSGEWITKSGNGGISSFFPDHWSQQDVLREVEWAISHNEGRNLAGAANEYYGFSRDRSVRIGFYLKADGSLGSYFPIVP